MTQPIYRQYQRGEDGTDLIENVVPFPTLVASSSVTVNLGVASRKSVFNQAFAAQFTAGTYGGTATVTIQKVTGGSTVTALTAAQSITAANLPVRINKAIPALTTLTDSQKTINPGDVLEAVFTLSSTVSVQPGGGIIGAETYLVV